MCVIYTLKNMSLMKEIEEDEKNGKISYIHKLEELILLKCPHYPKKYTDSMQSITKFQWQFSQKQKIASPNFNGNTKDPKQPKKS